MKDKKIYLAGHTGLLGAAILERLIADGGGGVVIRTHQELNLIRQEGVEDFFRKEKPEIVILAAAKVGGIRANFTYPADFIYENLAIQTNVIHSSYLYGVKKLLFFGSACSYPRESPQPIKEEYLLSGRLESTNEAYAAAKIAGIKMCQAYKRQYGVNFISAIPTNIYGPHDNFSLNGSHVIPALINRFHEAKINKDSSVTIWGTGKPIREFIYADDAAEAGLFLIDNYDNPDIVNIGTGEEVSIEELANIIKEISGYKGSVVFDVSKPDGTPRKVLDISKLNSLGWRARTSLREGIRRTYEWYISNNKNFSHKR